MPEVSVGTRSGGAPSVSVVIKALNEEAKIGRCIESALSALAELDGASEVILADSLSDDRTVETARHYPITIVQLADASERGCGTGVQLGYQHSRGDFVMLLDGDMQLLPGFLRKALDRFAADPKLAGVAGVIEDTSIVNEADRARVASGAISRPLSSARWLNGGGLYRRAAIVQVGGYAADRNLKAWEEAELGMRLTTAGWSLERIGVRSTLHTGHPDHTLALFRKRWVNRRAMASGVLIKQSLGKPWFPNVLLLLAPALLTLLLWALAITAMGICIVTQRWALAVGFSVTVAAMAVAFVLYKRSLTRALVSLGLYHYSAAALVLGLQDPIKDPAARIDSVVLARFSLDATNLASSPAHQNTQRTVDSVSPLTLDSG